MAFNCAILDCVTGVLVAISVGIYFVSRNLSLFYRNALVLGYQALFPMLPSRGILLDTIASHFASPGLKWNTKPDQRLSLDHLNQYYSLLDPVIDKCSTSCHFYVC